VSRCGAIGYTRRMPTYDFPRPALTVDVAVFRGNAGDREILLVKRGSDPFAGAWALPGGFVDEGESLQQAARRELAEETGLDPRGDLDQVGTYGDPGRDPRGWTVSVAFVVGLDWDDEGQVRAGSDATEVSWHHVHALPALAFDHTLIVADALRMTAFGA
jgi:8-oxo-dGTP diphosphatase